MKHLLVLLILSVSSSVAYIYSERCIQCIDIDVYFQAIAYDDSSFFFFNESQSVESLLPRIESNMEVLNHEFNATPFQFVWKDPDFVNVANQSQWTLDMCDSFARPLINNWSFLGDFKKDINVYLGHQMYDGRPDFVGCATFPHVRDNAIMLNFEVLPPEESGLTLAHEVGHWLGLLHPYEDFRNEYDDPCHAQNPGDFVDDTPASALFPFWANYTNQTSWDSCPGVPGEDSFFNIMNIACRRHSCFQGRGFFTEGQIQRMYELWLVLRDYNESCSDSQRRLDFAIIQQEFYHQFILFDGHGKEAFNLRKTVLGGTKRFLESNLCLLSDLPYAFVFYTTPTTNRIYSLTYDLNGEQGSLDRSLVLDIINATSILFLPASAKPESPMNLSSIYTPTAVENSCWCDPSSEALMEVTVSNGTVWLALFDATGQGMVLSSTQQYCLPKDRHYSVLAGFSLSNADLLEITLDGFVVSRVNGPFHNDIGLFPRIVSTIITPRMFEFTLSSPVPTEAPVTTSFPPPTTPPGVAPTTFSASEMPDKRWSSIMLVASLAAAVLLL